MSSICDRLVWSVFDSPNNSCTEGFWWIVFGDRTECVQALRVVVLVHVCCSLLLFVVVACVPVVGCSLTCANAKQNASDCSACNQDAVHQLVGAHAHDPP